MHDQTRASESDKRNIDWRTGSAVALLSAFGLFLLALIVTGQIWRAVAYGTVALFAFLVVLAIYFWGAMLFGGSLEVFVRRQRTATPWGIIGQSLSAPEHDIDPGLELFSAGMLVYRLGEVKPQPYFRKVPLANAHAVRPFVIARTGAERNYRFTFVLNDEVDATRFDDEFVFGLKNDPQVVMPSCRLLVERPRALVGQRWTLRVLSGMTVITSFRFIFVDGAAQPESLAAEIAPNASRSADDVHLAAWQEVMLPALLNEAVKRDAMTSTKDVVLEVV